MQPFVQILVDLSLKCLNDRAENSGCWILEMSNPQIWEKLTGTDKLFRLWHETENDVTATISLIVWQLLNLEKHMLKYYCVTILPIMNVYISDFNKIHTVLVQEIFDLFCMLHR